MTEQEPKRNLMTITVTDNMKSKLAEVAAQNIRSPSRHAAIILCIALGLDPTEELKYDRG